MQFKKRKIYAICGYAGIGKGPLAENLINILGYENSIHVNFADPIKKMLSVLGINDFVDKNEMTRFGLTKRELLISLGTNWGKNLLYDRSKTNYSEIDNYMDIWIRLFDETIHSIDNINKNIICSDLRFIDEYNYIRRMDGYIIRIKGKDRHNINHVSEEYFKNFVVNYELNDEADYKKEAWELVFNETG